MFASAKFKWFITGILFVLLAYIFKAYLPIILKKMNSFGAWAPFLFLIIYCLSSVLCLPTILLVLAGGALFGPITGALLNLSGASLGAISGFCISRHFKSVHFSSIKNSRIQTLILKAEQQGWKSVALLRLTPFVPYNLVNYAFGFTQIRFKVYLLASIVFLIPSKILMTYFGYYGITIFDYENIWIWCQNSYGSWFG